MTNLLEIGSAWLGEKMQAHAASTVSYYRGAQSVSVSATVGRPAFEVDGGDGGKLSYEVRDYLIPAADLILGGTVTEPKVGDQVRHTIGETTFVYEVLEPMTLSSGGVGQLEPHFRYSDEFRKLLRIHTKLVSEE